MKNYITVQRRIYGHTIQKQLPQETRRLIRLGLCVKLGACFQLCASLWLIPTEARSSTNYYAQATAAETNVFMGQVFNLDILVKAMEKPDTPNTGSIEEFNITVLDAGKPTNQENTWLYRFERNTHCKS